MASRPELLFGTVFRLSSHDVTKRHSATGGIEPQAADFRLTDAQQAELKAGNGGVGALSVWIPSHTKPIDARAFLTPNHQIVFNVDVAALVTASLHVYHSPLSDARDGAQGHCDVEDVWGGSDAAMRRIRLDILSAVIGRGSLI